MMDEFLVLTAVGTDRPGIVADLTRTLSERGANVADSRMAVLGGEFAVIVLVAASRDDLAGIRSDLQSLGERLGLDLLIKDTRSPSAHRAGRVRSYDIAVHALDHPGIVHAVSAALQGLGGNIISLDTSAYQAAVTGAPLFEMRVTADFPEAISASRLREALAQVSDAANADVEVRPA